MPSELETWLLEAESCPIHVVCQMKFGKELTGKVRSQYEETSKGHFSIGFICVICFIILSYPSLYTVISLCGIHTFNL